MGIRGCSAQIGLLVTNSRDDGRRKSVTDSLRGAEISQ